MTLLQEELLESALNAAAAATTTTTTNDHQLTYQTTGTNHNTTNTSNNIHLNSANMQRHCETALLAKLQEMVPIMPRERELTKLEIINYVIDYIRHLKELVVLDNSL